MDWQATLNSLRLQLPRVREAGGMRGSLRWLEEAMKARGASPSSVRNIVYQGIGTASDKRALHGLLSELAAQVGQTLPDLPASLRLPMPAELELLGRQKRRAFRQFLAAVRQAQQAGANQGGTDQNRTGARLIVSGPAGAGKTLLMTHLERACGQLDAAPGVTRLTLGGDLTPHFPGLSLQAAQPYALQAEAQARAARALLGTLRGVLLLRVAQAGDFGGLPTRGSDGSAISLTAWAAEELYRLAPPGLSVLLAVEDASALPPGLPGDVIRLAPPTPAEARRYLMAQLNIPAGRADELVRQTGRNLDRLTLLAAAKTAGQEGEDGQDTLSRLLADPAAARLLAALSVAFASSGHAPEAGLPTPLLEAALGHPLTELPAHVRALLDESDPQALRPLSASLIGAAGPLLLPAELKTALTRLANGAATQPQLAAAHLDALARLGRWAELTRWLEEEPGGLALAPTLWSAARGRVQGEPREALARAVVSRHAMLGAYGHPQARDALFALLDSPRAAVRAWARVKLAESSVDSGNFEAAEAQLNHPELTGPLKDSGNDRWLQGAQADALLVEAALARWRGDLDRATRLAADPRTQDGGALGNPARAALWRGLIAKDAGRWAEAMTQLESVPDSHPLLSARARYQQGDLRLRLGQPAAALELLQDAAARLALDQAAPEEQARVGGRIATALRRLGQTEAALAQSRRATALAGQADPVLRARLESESVPVLLALFRPDEALRVAAAALDLLTRPGQRLEEAAYRERRTRYRVALAYLTRGAGQPYLQPFGGALTDTPDTAQARRVLDLLLNPQGSVPDSAQVDREQVLTFDILLSRALAEPDPEAALGFARRALAMTDHPYAETQARATLADALLRAGQPERALHETNRAHALLRRVAHGLGEIQAPDPGLHALLLTLEARCLLAELAQPPETTLHWLKGALDEQALSPFRAQVWREIGAALDVLQGGSKAAALVFPELPLDVLRLRDALSIAAGRHD